jgi:hypothetical protein
MPENTKEEIKNEQSRETGDINHIDVLLFRFTSVVLVFTYICLSSITAKTFDLYRT